MSRWVWVYAVSVVIIAIAGLLCGCARKNASATSLTIKGSDTMVNLMSNLAEAYMSVHPTAHVSVTGGGSGTGIAALVNGTTTICAASRMLTLGELQTAQDRGIHPLPVVIGLDGISVMLNRSNPVSELSVEQLRKIYAGEYTNWSEVGGPDMPIIVLSRESSSGTYVYFQEHVLNKRDYSASALLLPSTAAVVKAVSEDPGAIGYGGIAYAEHGPVKIAAIKAAPDSAAILPSPETVRSGSYPVSRPLFLYTDGVPTGQVGDFIAFCLSDAGRKIITDTGYILTEKTP